ncbi:MAG: hypothetical protein OEZ68_12435 [Gammaproteobacteria bacterium]|nr:hypothetical protein [Gammaproteobacteria bacterium]MDH5801603.1 hypothetical protein [Gammaproteobacteria bacterium]
MGDADTVLVGDMKPHISPKFSATPKPSLFLGCNTNIFAKRWNTMYGVPTEGASGKVHFGVINTGKASVDIVDRIKQSSTVRWETFK